LDEELLEQAVVDVAKLRGTVELKRAPDPTNWNNFDYLWELVEYAMTGVSGDKGPGYPLNLQYHTNFDLDAAAVRETKLAAVARLYMYMEADSDFEELLKLPHGLVQAGFADPASVFIKTEPHPSRKVEKRAYRCISAVSLPDQLVESVLFGEFSRELMKPERIFKNGSAIGIGFSDEQMSDMTKFVSQMELEHGPTVCDDVGGFDATHTLQTLLATCRIDALTVSVPGGNQCWNTANARWALNCAYSSAMIGGKLYYKIIPGMLNSGSKDTSRRNTMLRSLYTGYFARASGQVVKHQMANGDDSLTWGITNLEAYKAAAIAAGFNLRDVKQSRGNFNFCSHDFDVERGVATLSSWHKGVYKMLCSKDAAREDFMQFARESRHNLPVYELITQLVFYMTQVEE
jgi:hypothetical protein